MLLGITNIFPSPSSTGYVASIYIYIIELLSAVRTEQDRSLVLFCSVLFCSVVLYRSVLFYMVLFNVFRSALYIRHYIYIYIYINKYIYIIES